MPHLFFWLAVATAVVFSLLALFLRFGVMPNIESYQGKIVSKVAEVSGMDVAAKSIRGGWSGFRPYVEMTDVAFHDANASEPALRLPRMNVSLSWWALLLGQIRFNQVVMLDPALMLNRDAEGLIYFAGKPINKPSADNGDQLISWLLAQQHVEIRNATLVWSDAMAEGKAAGAEVTFRDVALRVEKSGDTHRIGFQALPPAELSGRIAVQATLQIDRVDKLWQTVGNIFITANDANLATLRSHLPVPVALKAGIGNVRTWLEIDSAKFAGKNPLQRIIADINVVNASVQLSEELAPLNLARLAGRVTYLAHDGGYSIASKALEFRTAEGVVQKPADFSVTLMNNAATNNLNAAANTATNNSSEITANGIDLKVIAALLEYFPVGNALRDEVARFAPRGNLVESRLSWQGDLAAPQSLVVDGSVSNFGVRADGDIPGVSGLTAKIKGDEKGGTISIDSQNIALDMPTIFRAPLRFDTLQSEASWKKVANNFSINIEKAQFANATTAGELSGRYWRESSATNIAPNSAGNIDIKGSLTRGVATGAQDYLPNAIKTTRDYLAWAIVGGAVESADFILKGELDRFPFHGGAGGQFAVHAKIKDVEFRHTEGWPGIQHINGELEFENTKFAAKVEDARIYTTLVKNTLVSIEDMTLADPVLTIKGEANAGGKDMLRYLRESPLVQTVGTFSRNLDMEGAGKLDLALSIPLVSDKAVRVNGKYQISNASVKLEVGPTISAVNGAVQFTEGSVKSAGLSGTAFANPLTATLSGGGNNDVLLNFSGHADIAQIAALLPFPLPSQVAGAADFSGHLVAKSAGKTNSTDIAIESNLVGIGSTLPYPMMKSADESKKISVSFVNTATASERIRVQYGDLIDTRLQRKFDAKGNSAGLYGGVVNIGQTPAETPVPAGLWLAGRMDNFDFDQWRNAIAVAYPATTVASKGTSNPTLDSALTGFDLKLGTLLAFGRPFSAMTVKGRSANGDWLATAEGTDIVGDVAWRPNAYNERGSVRARLSKFVLTDSADETSATPTPLADTDVPALDVIAEHFSLNNREWGKLELQAQPQGADWKIEKLNISNGHAALDANGLWLRNGAGGKSRTTLNLKLKVKNLNALFNQFGYKDLRGGSGSLEGALSWPGHVYQYVSNNLSGQIKLQALDGQFDKIAPGAGKLLSLISLQSIPRRLTFDFHDLFSEGFAFNSINGDCKIENGIITTDNFVIVGTSAEVKMEGDVSLPKEQQNLRLTIAPKIGESVALGAGLLFTPVIGAAVLAVEKLLQNPIDKILSYQYRVTGTWDNPLLERIGAAPPPPPTPALPTVNATAAKPTP